MAASGATPALPGELPQGCRGLAVDRHLNIMYRRIWLTTGVHPASVVGTVLGSIPSPDSQVNPADEGERIVHYYDLLVV
jgi:hypothetical protein